MAELKQELTTMDLCRMFGVSRQSIFNWRKPDSEDTSKVVLPYYKLGGNGLSDPTRYSLDATRKYANESGRIIVNDIFVGSVRPASSHTVAKSEE